jgi:hypothetical protein
VAEQWWHDIDQLMVTAINTPPHERWCPPSMRYSHTPSVVYVSSSTHILPVVHTPLGLEPSARPLAQHPTPMASYATADLRVELNRHCGGENSCITNERLCERRQDVKGRNLKKEFDTHVPARGSPAARVPQPPTSPGVLGGCMALAPHLWMVVWPHKFWPHLPKKYDGNVNPTEFLQIYSTSILAVGGNEVVMANYFPMALTGMARFWLMNLPEGTLDSRSELCRQFTANFESAYAWLGNETDLHTVP